MSSISEDSHIGVVAWLKQKRRRYVKQTGKRFIRGLADFLAQQSLVGDKPVMDSRDFPFLEKFTQNWETIRDEIAEVLKHREAVPTFQEVSPDQKRIAKGNNWRTFILFGFGEKLPKNCAKTPVTTRLLEQVPNLQTAWFSILAPGYHIPAHRGVSKGILRAHLGLIVPKDAERCRLRVADQICVWREGEIFVFDDTYEHEVWNDTEDERVILLFDFDRPMRFWGRLVNSSFVKLLKLTAYYQEPKKNMQSFEDRFEAATRRADANLEKLSDEAQS
ncbi:aspartyl/asparaginyl beta-hydroxylase domain-containing protein [Rhodoligotrophos ferricapiens]|uniref:aspartyl/asparaginyl beta-hydroxylase domain-containing protein n=1 Tax=Rhodoligotrophos ferricapiens TaxID=3069264 RepID=UPI00315DF6FC